MQLRICTTALAFLDAMGRITSPQKKTKTRAVTRALIGGGDVYSYIRVMPDELLLKSVVRQNMNI